MSRDWVKMGYGSSPALSKIWVLQTTWTDLSVELQDIVDGLWRNHELGNDHYILKTSIIDLAQMQEEGVEADKWYWGETKEEQKGWISEPLDITPLIKYLEDKGVGTKEEVWSHLWW